MGPVRGIILIIPTFNGNPQNKRNMMLLRCTVSLSLLGVVFSYPWFPLEIPNGDKVPHPCWLDTIWDGVGHKNNNGGGARNPFGIAFMKASFRWCKELCEADSDGDGDSNGKELGDPLCVWKKGDTPAQPASGHPGICEDVSSPKCKIINNWEICNQKMFDCASIQQPGVTTLELRFPKTLVPNKETNYYCMLFELPHDKDYHIIADQPIKDNRYTIHHMLLYACPVGTDVTELKKMYDKPAPCGMLAQSTCGNTIVGWTVGGVGDCFDDIDAGTRIGKTAYKYAILEVHWNNPELETGWEDGSGMKLYLTEVLRTHDLAVLVVGQMGLRIPPKSEAFEHEATCSSKCTKEQLGDTSIYVVSAGLHMHYNGSKAYIDLYRDNKHIATLGADEPFIYDSPVDHNHDPPIEIRPGDELRTRCVYNTSKRMKHVYYGDATSDEMCFAYITYYPKTDFRHCVHFGSAELCNGQQLEYINGCKTGDFEEYVKSALLWRSLDTLHYACDNTGIRCLSNCKKLLMKPNADPCLTGDARMYLETGLSELREEGEELLHAFRSCDITLYLESLGSGVRSVLHETRPVLVLGILGLCVISYFVGS